MQPARSMLALAVVVLAAPAATAVDGGRAFTIEDLYRLSPVVDPVVSPDGRSIAYTVTTRDLQAGKESLNLWRVDPDGKNARALTWSDGKRNESPAFSPDGKSLAFVSDRDGDSQLFVTSLSGGEPQQKTRFPGGVGSPRYVGDGTRIALVADVYPGCGADADCNRKRDQERQKGALKAHLADRLLYRHWTSWKDGKRSHILLLDLATGKLRDLTPGDFDAPVFSLNGPSGFDVSPDGKELAFTANRGPGEALDTNADVWTVSLNEDELAAARSLTKGNPAWDGTPRYSPDGRYLAYRTQRVPGWEADRFRIALLERRSGEVHILTESFDDTVGDIAWSADSRTLYFTADVKGRTPLLALDVATGAVRTLSALGTLDGFGLAPDGSWAVVARRRVGEPWELHRLGLKAPAEGKDTRLTTHNAAVEGEVDIRPAEEISVAGADGKPVQVFIVKPHGFDPAKKYPLILNVHGGPQSQWADAFRGDWQVYPGAGYVVAFPNPHGSTGFGEAYTRAISGDWNGKVMEDISKVTDALARLPYVDPDRVGAMGWSWGGYAMMWLEGHETRFKALAAMMGVYDLRSMYSSTEEVWFPEFDFGGPPWEQAELYRRQSPSESVPAFKTPCLVITGEKDFRVPYTQSLAFFTDLQRRGVPSRLLVFEKAGHWPSAYEMSLYYAAHLDWFHRYLGGAPSPFDPEAMVASAGIPKTRPKPKPATYALGLLTRGTAWSPEPSPERERIQAAHLANIRRLAETGKLVAAGPMGDDGRLRGLFVFKTETLREAQSLADTDPAVRAGRLDLEIHPFQSGEGIGAGYDPARLKGDVPDEMVEQRLVFLRRKPGASPDPALVQQVQDEQAAWVDRHYASGKLSVGGSFTDDGEIRGLLVFAPDLLPEEAKRLQEDAPALRRGLYEAEAHTWWVAKGVLP
jgi:dipeptidyl aminopeptidase/acylaminoacyl peptidase/uncharacterized protein YciI